jgi:hypothetical protein
MFNLFPNKFEVSVVDVHVIHKILLEDLHKDCWTLTDNPYSLKCNQSGRNYYLKYFPRTKSFEVSFNVSHTTSTEEFDYALEGLTNKEYHELDEAFKFRISAINEIRMKNESARKMEILKSIFPGCVVNKQIK